MMYTCEGNWSERTLYCCNKRTFVQLNAPDLNTACETIYLKSCVLSLMAPYIV
uniref:Uncharacterized protein n=1 Tax=Arundo donax TaxID=35708 RepID=A0A0A9HUL1_ARUDO